ncbi:MAG TPA: 2-oxoisovalerate dehydrogenase [Methanosarcinaceae archaeon]|nr:2-oxoisovalerate dehydrogenase [Methanosarcinaceae archaeon]
MNEIMFLIEDDPYGGYNAQALGYSIFTEGETVSEIKENIVDALSCHFDNLEDIPKVIRLHFVKEEILTYAPNAKGCFA